MTKALRKEVPFVQPSGCLFGKQSTSNFGTSALSGRTGAKVEKEVGMLKAAGSCNCFVAGFSTMVGAFVLGFGTMRVALRTPGGGARDLKRWNQS